VRIKPKAALRRIDMNPGRTRIACGLAVAGLMLSPSRAARADVVLEWNAIAACDGWPNIHVEDAFTCDAATRALEGASRWLAQPKCQTLFLEFKDRRNLPLTAKLRELETDPEGYLRMVLFLDGAQSATCRRHGVLAFTTQGSRVVYLCGRDFERAWRRGVAEVQATVIHELLHSLGLGENPPSPREITHRIQQLCW
jgi:hypothetical protein